ncbi:MAG: DUF4381 domain-containing protein [Gammaproteobacteria bacterium]
MTASHSNPLQGLRDLHLPPPVSAWPPAPGWWLLGLLVLVLLLGAFWLWRRHRRQAYRRVASKQLAQLRTGMQQGQADTAIIAELSILLRRVAISRYGRDQVAALHGPDWLAFLDRTGRTDAFTRQGRALLDAPYQRHSGQAAAPLLDLAQRWLRLQS